MTKKTRQYLYIPALLLLVVGAVWVIYQNKTMPYQKCEGMVFGTFYQITYQSDEDLQKGIEAELQKVDNSLSPFNKKSIITAINNNEDPELNGMFVDVYDLAHSVSEDTQGAFDITVAPLVNLWGFGFKNDCPPSDKAVDSIRQFVGYQKVKLAGKKIQKDDKRIMLDCSAIAKGYGVDIVAAYLRAQGVKNFMINIGGEIITQGLNPTQNKWQIGIEKPLDDSTQQDNGNQTILALNDQALATSGNYRNFYYKDGKKFAHTIDPRTGKPVQHNILSATVLGPTCAKADAYATSFMVLGLDGAKQILERNKDLKAYLIYTDASGKYLVWTNLPKDMVKE